MAMIDVGQIVRGTVTDGGGNAMTSSFRTAGGVTQRPMVSFAVQLTGAKEMADMFKRVPLSVLGDAMVLTTARVVKHVQQSISRRAENIPSRWSMGVYSRSLDRYVQKVTRVHVVGHVGIKKSYREGPYQQDIDMERSPFRKPAKYWHWVEWGSFNVRTGRRNKAHHLVYRAVMQTINATRRIVEFSSIQVLAAHFRTPPLTTAVAAGGVAPMRRIT